MSAAWHEHLNHLSWWEQIDRFFFPSKYSCSTYVSGGEVARLIFLSVFVAMVVIGVLLIYFHLKKWGVIET